MAKSLFTKGEEIYVFAVAYGSLRASYRRFIVDSCGPKQMHLRTADDGKFAKFRLHGPFGNCESVSKVADPDARALERAIAAKQEMVKMWEDKLTGADGSSAWLEGQGRELGLKALADTKAQVPHVRNVSFDYFM